MNELAGAGPLVFTPEKGCNKTQTADQRPDRVEIPKAFFQRSGRAPPFRILFEMHEEIMHASRSKFNIDFATTLRKSRQAAGLCLKWLLKNYFSCHYEQSARPADPLWRKESRNWVRRLPD